MGPATKEAGDWASGSTSADAYASRIASIRQGLSETGFWRARINDRISLGGRPLRPIANNGRGTRSSPGGRNSGNYNARGCRCKGSDHDSSHRFRSWRGSRNTWAGRKPQPAWWQSHGCEFVERRTRSKTVGASARGSAYDKIVGLLVNPTSPNAAALSKDVQAAADKLAIQLPVQHASAEGDFEPVFASLRELGARALVIGTDPLFNAGSEVSPCWQFAI